MIEHIGNNGYNDLHEVYTTGEAAKICMVSQQTIIRMFDTGGLKGFKVPGSRFRRIPRSNLLTFMRDHNIPLPSDVHEHFLALTSTPREDVRQAIEEQLQLSRRRLTLHISDDAFEAGMAFHEFRPQTVFVDQSLGQPAEVMIKGLSSKSERAATLEIVDTQQELVERLQKLMTRYRKEETIAA
jgi:excisionase family DNA binding protein